MRTILCFFPSISTFISMHPDNEDKKAACSFSGPTSPANTIVCPQGIDNDVLLFYSAIDKQKRNDQNYF